MQAVVVEDYFTPPFLWVQITALLNNLQVFYACVSFLSLVVLHVIARGIAWRWYPGERALSALNPSDQIYVAEKVCSTLNGLICGFIGIYLVILSPTSLLMNGDVFTSFPPLLEVVYPHYLAYTLYDMITMAFQAEQHWSMWVHHIAGALGSFSMILYRRCAFFTIFVLMTEMTAIFNNALWYAQHVNVTAPIQKSGRTSHRSQSTKGSSPSYRSRSKSPSSLLEVVQAVELATIEAESGPNHALTSSPLTPDLAQKPKPPPSRLVLALLWLRAFSFILFRVWVVPYALYWAIDLSGGVYPFVSDLFKLPIAVAILCPLILLSFGILNILWTVAVIRIYRKAAARRKGKSNEKEEVRKRK